MGVLDDAIREHLDLKRRRGASDDEIASAEAEALGPARRALYDDEDDGEGLGPGETIVIPPVHDPAPPPATPTRAVHDIDEELMPPPPAGARVERPDLDAPAADPDAGPDAAPDLDATVVVGPDIDPLDQDTVEHPPPSSQLPFDHDEDEPDDAEEDPGAEPPGRVSE
ncbi:MAG: hypothetical protein ACJ760_02035 [Thermoleophilaceae bacterium]